MKKLIVLKMWEISWCYIWEMVYNRIGNGDVNCLDNWLSWLVFEIMGGLGPIYQKNNMKISLSCQKSFHHISLSSKSLALMSFLL